VHAVVEHDGVEGAEEKETLQQKRDKLKILRNNWNKYKYDDWNRDVFENNIEEWDSFFLWFHRLLDNKVISILKKIEFKKWVLLDLSCCWMTSKWVEVLSKMKLDEWVWIRLDWNHIWSKWARVLSDNMKLEEWVYLSLRECDLWGYWAEAISHIKLKRWVALDLSINHIWDMWAEYLMNNMELEEWVILDLSYNYISEDMKDKLIKWWQSCKDCKIIV